jgi:hypothetical protein
MTARKIATRPRVRRVRVHTRLSIPVRKRLAEYCAAKGVSERTVIEVAVDEHLDGTSDIAALLARLDRLDVLRARAAGPRDLASLRRAPYESVRPLSASLVDRTLATRRQYGSQRAGEVQSANSKAKCGRSR